VLFQGIQHRWRQYDGAYRRFGFRSRHASRAAELFVDPQLSGGEVEIIPLERQKLALPQTSGQLQKKYLIISLCLSLNQKSLHFLSGEDLHLLSLHWRQLAANSWILRDQLFSFAFSSAL
jgi:hypothetical protein